MPDTPLSDEVQKQVDVVAARLHEALKPYIGTTTVTPQFVEALKADMMKVLSDVEAEMCPTTITTSADPADNSIMRITIRSSNPRIIRRIAEIKQLEADGPGA